MKLVALALACLLVVGCSRNLSRTEAIRQLKRSPELLVGAQYMYVEAYQVKDRHIGAVVNPEVVEIFPDGPRARVKFSYEVHLDDPKDSALFPPAKDQPMDGQVEAQGVWVGDASNSFFVKLANGNYESFAEAYFERADSGWKLQQVKM